VEVAARVVSEGNQLFRDCSLFDDPRFARLRHSTDQTPTKPSNTSVGTVTFFLAVLTVRYGVKWRRSDFVCLTGAAGVGALGFLTDSALNALCAAMAVDFLALFPTVAKTWKHPDWEEAFPWMVTVAASALTVMAVALPWEVEIAAYPVYLLVMNSVVLALIYRPKVRVSLVSVFRRW